MFYAQEAESEITRCLAVISTNVALQNRGLQSTDLNHGAERFFCALLNRLYPYDLVNINIEQPNAAAIDLGDRNGEIAIQVTSSVDNEKVKSTVKKYANHDDLRSQYQRLVVLRFCQTSCKKSGKTYDFNGYEFDRDRDIWCLDDLVARTKTLGTDELFGVISFIYAEVNTTIRSTRPRPARHQLALPVVGARFRDFDPGYSDAQWAETLDGIATLATNVADLEVDTRQFMAGFLEEGLVDSSGGCASAYKMHGKLGMLYRDWQPMLQDLEQQGGFWVNGLDDDGDIVRFGHRGTTPVSEFWSVLSGFCREERIDPARILVELEFDLLD